MARNNIYLGTLAGKLGDNVFWRAKGQQRVRTYVPRTEAMVGYEAAERRARFANLKGIYQWLPEPFKQACSLHRIGGNSYADFMMQYNSFNEERMRSTFGAGRFLPVNCKISNGTLGYQADTVCEVTQMNVGGGAYEYTKGIIFRTIRNDVIDEDNVGTITCGLIRKHPFLRTGDIMHIFLSFLIYDDVWGGADIVEGFPFTYDNMIYARVRLDENNSESLEEASGGMVEYGSGDWGYGDCFAINPQRDLFPYENKDLTSMCAGLMFERPSAPRQQRFSPAKLMFDRSQKMILNADARGRWNDYCTRSFMKG